jgi:hypothetical protein
VPAHADEDCGTGYCEHGRQKSKCKDCGTGHCDHGRQEGRCKDCGTGYCEHGRAIQGLRHGPLRARALGKNYADVAHRGLTPGGPGPGLRPGRKRF